MTREPISTRDWDKREGRVAIRHAEERNEVRLIFQRGTGINSWCEVVMTRGDFSRLIANGQFRPCQFRYGRELLELETA